MQEYKHQRTDEPRYPADDTEYGAGDPARRVAQAERNRRRLTVCSVIFGVVAVLAVAAVLAMPHFQMRDLPAAALPEPQPTAVPTALPTAAPTETPEPTATPEPTPEPYYTQLDDWRLVLVNSEVALPKDYAVTPRLYSDVEVSSLIYEPLTEMLNAARDAGVSLWLASGYRSVEDQEAILAQAIQERMYDRGMTVEEATENALRTIQPPRHSEHHTGLAVDFNDVSRDFEQTEAYAWLEEHAADYGFVQRYPKDKAEITGIDHEAWHYRYVGPEHAKAMKELGMCLEEYCMYLKGTPIGPVGEAGPEDAEAPGEEEN